MTDRAGIKAGWTKMKSGNVLTKYKSQNPGEVKQIDAYVDAIAAGQNPVEPNLRTLFGDGFTDLVAAALKPDPPPPPPPPPPPTGCCAQAQSAVQPMLSSMVSKMMHAVRRKAGVPSSPVWVPTPPSSYSSSGVVSHTLLGSITGSWAAGLEQATWHPNSPRVTVTPSGDIFVCYNYLDNQTSPGDEVYKCVKWSSDGGATFPETIYDTQYSGKQGAGGSGDPVWGNSAGLWSDADGNVYFLNNIYSNDGGNPRSTQIHKLAPPYSQNYTRAGTLIATISGAASGKWGTWFDQTCQWLWISFWDRGGFNQLWAYDTNGTLQKSIAVQLNNDPSWPPPASLYGRASYSTLYSDSAGRLIYGWTCESTSYPTGGFPAGQPQHYYGAFYIYSDDCGDTWIGKNGAVTLPLSSDNNYYGAADQLGFELCEHGVDWIKGGDANYGDDNAHLNFNLLNRVAINKGYLHSHYYADSVCFGGSSHAPYVRNDFGTGFFRKGPEFSSDDGSPVDTQGATDGFFVQDTSFSNRLYYVSAGRAGQGNLGKIVVFKCDNSDAATPTWLLYAISSSAPGANISFINCCPWVQTDGSIVGAFTDAINHDIWFFRVDPV